MKTIWIFLLFLSMAAVSNAQETVVQLSPEMFTGNQEIQLASVTGWLFRDGNDANWAKPEIDTKDWQRKGPKDLNVSMADSSGTLEGWLRLKFRVDESFAKQQLGIRYYCWAAADLYIDGKYVRSFGNTGANGKPYQEFNPNERLPMLVDLEVGKQHVIALHIVDKVVRFPGTGLKANESGLSQFMKLTGPNYYKTFAEYLSQIGQVSVTTLCISGVLAFLFLLLAFQNRGERYLWAIFIYTLATFLNALASDLSSGSNVPYFERAFFIGASDFLFWIRSLMIPVILVNVFKKKFTWALKHFMALTIFLAIGLGFFHDYWFFIWICSGVLISGHFLISESGQLKNARAKEKLVLVFKSVRVFLILTLIMIPISIFATFLVPFALVYMVIVLSAYYLFVSRKSIKGAHWAIVAGLVLTCVWMAVMFSMSSKYESTIFPYNRVYNMLTHMSLPLALLVYLAMRFNEILTEVQANSSRVIQLSEEKKQQAISQQKILQEEVNRQTAEIRSTLENLKATQSQLVQSEKMASLGELTAGIAHEIQNPLNFVNNFSEINKELVAEMKAELENGNVDEARQIATDIATNEEKINHHGKRADAIVKGMLQHSQSSSGKKEPTDINALADEYLRLSYHGVRAKDKTFNAKLETDFDASVGKVEIVAQDFGRVILNLLTNAFYAVNEKQKSGIENYEPTVSIATKKVANSIEIYISDNGNGIPSYIVDKIFQPFFTTKPTGSGTGLGLSLAYDIVKAHLGELKVMSEEGKGTRFVIGIPGDVNFKF